MLDRRAFGLVVVALLFWQGCSKPRPVESTLSQKSAPPKAPLTANFATPWQDETQYIVGTIATDVIEMVCFANHRAPLPAEVDVRVSETKGSPDDLAHYRVRVQLAEDKVLECDLPIKTGIWDPLAYQPLVRALADHWPLAPGEGKQGDDNSDLRRALTGPRAEVLAKLDVQLSEVLAKEFNSAARHEDAALLLAAFTLREASGLFFQIRAELCRITAHLVFARELRGDPKAGVNGALAKAVMLALCNNQSAALEQLDRLPDDRDLLSWKRSIRMRVTGDYRSGLGDKDETLFERLETFRAHVRSVNTKRAWAEAQLPETLLSLADFLRAANEDTCPVEVGHILLDLGLRAELRETQLVFGEEEGEPFVFSRDIARLNAEPTRCVGRSNKGEPRVRILGWGLWAAFLQRHICHTIVANFKFMDKMWGVPQDAREFRTQMDEQFGVLRLYPFVRRQCATDQAYYRKAQDDEMAVVRYHPECVPASAWNEICYTVPFGPVYYPPPHPFINEWHRHNPPPGTAYNIFPRLNHPSLIERPDVVAQLERLHTIAPYDTFITRNLLRIRDGNKATAATIEQAYATVIDFCPIPARRLANLNSEDPALYETWMRRAARIDPSNYYSLAWHYIDTGRETEGARMFEQWIENEVDEVSVSNSCRWLIEYYERTGTPDRATQLAERAAETYSAQGLLSKAWLLEKRRRFDDALDLLEKVRERYDDPAPLLGFLFRLRKNPSEKRFVTLCEKAIRNYLPGGLEQFAPDTSNAPPRQGVRVSTENDAVRTAGLRRGDIVVAVRGWRVTDWRSYVILRNLEPDAPYVLSAWRDGHYFDVKPLGADFRFGLDFVDYRAP